jgi:hypothetical protein
VNKSKQALSDFVSAQKEKDSADKKMDLAAQEFIESLMGDSEEDALAMFDILRTRLEMANNAFVARMKYREKQESDEIARQTSKIEARKTFFGRAYDLVFGKNRP